MELYRDIANSYPSTVTTNAANYPFPASNIFDDTSYYRSSIIPKLPEYIQISFNNKVSVVEKYAITAGVRNQDITSWELRGSNDNFATSTIIDKQSGFVFSQDGTHVRREFEVKAPEGFQSYRLWVLERPGTNSWGLFRLELLERDIQNRYLVKTGEEIITYRDSEWVSLGSPILSQELFNEEGMESIDGIPAGAWTEEAKILNWSDVNVVKKITARTMAELHDKIKKAYTGIGKVETEVEELPARRKQLFLSADHTGASFEYSLNGGETWYTGLTDTLMDITGQEGNSLVVRVTLPTEDSTITALSYAWA